MHPLPLFVYNILILPFTFIYHYSLDNITYHSPFVILKIVTLGRLDIWVLIDLFMIVIGKFKDKVGYKLYLLNSNE